MFWRLAFGDTAITHIWVRFCYGSIHVVHMKLAVQYLVSTCSRVVSVLDSGTEGWRRGVVVSGVRQ